MKRLSLLLVTLLMLSAPAGQLAAAGARASGRAVEALTKYLAEPVEGRPALGEQEFAGTPLTEGDAKAAGALLWKDHEARIRVTRKAEMDARRIKVGNLEMPFYYKIFGDKPKEAAKPEKPKPKVLKEKVPVKKDPAREKLARRLKKAGVPTKPKASYGHLKNKSEITVQNIPERRESRTQKKERIKPETAEYKQRAEARRKARYNL